MEHAVHTSCILCSLGCRVIIERRFNEAAVLEYDRGDPVFGGKLCSKGNYALELINHPLRLTEPKAGGKIIGWRNAVERMAHELSYAKAAGVIIGGEVSVEDAVLAKNFVETCLPGGRMSMFFATGDDRVCRVLADSCVAGLIPAMDDIRNSVCIVAVGDPFEIGPVISGPILQAKHARRGNTFAVISNGRTRTSRFATVHFPGPERSTLAGLLRCIADKSGNGIPAWVQAVRKHIPAPSETAIANLAAAFMGTPSGVMILETQDPVTAQLAALAVRAAGGGRKLYPVLTYANAAGICRAVKDTEPVEKLIRAAAQGEVDTLIVLGADPVRGGFGEDMRSARGSLRFMAAGASFANGTTGIADLVFPTALWLEREGIYNNVRLIPAVEPPGGAMSCGDVFLSLAEEMGKTLPSAAVKTVWEDGEPSAEMVEMLATRMAGEPPAPAVRSSTVRYGDGSLTDYMSWYTFSGVNGW